ncbi:hypothetical protein K505DRAFT_417163 [Melanomma pulvis-pyrius CBS 109.77]|uniref:Uncharacterized protein n=1 Tax=Melanomma pulvis-pyrius CBS 109.77 TaxID=1314802 RepID=A0A6A6XD50_9PLEO|nr:hypothetical protein K505DRAFT_417163 [Melanomma pulvis-pyrius CBS 109.77]
MAISHTTTSWALPHPLSHHQSHICIPIQPEPSAQQTAQTPSPETKNSRPPRNEPALSRPAQSSLATERSALGLRGPMMQSTRGPRASVAPSQWRDLQGPLFWEDIVWEQMRIYMGRGTGADTWVRFRRLCLRFVGVPWLKGQRRAVNNHDRRLCTGANCDGHTA